MSKRQPALEIAEQSRLFAGIGDVIAQPPFGKAFSRLAAVSSGGGLAGGLVLGLRTMLGTTALAALLAHSIGVETGQLAAALLLGAGLSALLVALRSGLSGAIAQPQDGPAVILATLVSAILIPDAVGGRTELLAAAIAFGTLLTGAMMYAIGRWRLGQVVRVLPYPVIGGFLGGSGILIVASATRFKAGEAWEVSGAWIAGMLVGCALFVLGRRWRSVWLVPLAVLVATVATMLVALVAGTPLEALQSAGWLPPKLQGEPISPLTWVTLPSEGWLALSHQSMLMLSVPLVSIVSLLLNLSGVELAAGQDVDFDRELRVAGGANLLGGLAGGVISFHSLSASLTAYRQGTGSRQTGIIVAVSCLVGAAAGSSLLQYIPKPVVTGLLLSLGLGLAWDWIVAGIRRMPLAEYAVVLSVAIVVALAGYLPGVFVGLVLATATFVVTYSKLRIIRRELSGRELRSSVERGGEERAWLDQHGTSLRVLKLEGFLFFGTAHALLSRVRLFLSQESVEFVVLDFSSVSAMDSSAAKVVDRIAVTCHQHHCELRLVNANPKVASSLQAALASNPGPAVPFDQDLDLALEYCEQGLLDRRQDRFRSAKEEVWHHLFPGLPPEQIAAMTGFMRERQFAPHEYLMKEGEPSDGLFMVTEGRVAILLTTESGHQVRVRSMAPGTLIGEVGVVLGESRTASAQAEGPCRAWWLGSAAFAEMASAAPELHRALVQSIVRLLAERLATTNRLLERVAQ